MIPLLNTANRNVDTLPPVPGLRRTEADIIAGRIASAVRWRRRRARLRLRAALFGRPRKARLGKGVPGRVPSGLAWQGEAAARSAAPRPPQAA